MILTFQISINGTLFAKFKHRLRPEEITHLRFYGDAEPQKLEYRSKHVIIPPKEMYWRILGGGHFLKAESCTVHQSQIIWALGKDSACIPRNSQLIRCQWSLPIVTNCELRGLRKLRE